MKSSVSSQFQFCNSKPSSFGCITVVFRRFLCSGRSSKRPSHQIDDGGSTVQNNQPQAQHTVAKLIGLDPLDVTGIRLDPVTRSRSMNSIDCRKACVEQKQESHRRAKSNDLSTYVELEDEDFFIISFEYGKDSGERKREECRGESRQRTADENENPVNKAEKRGPDAEDTEMVNLDRFTTGISGLLENEGSNFSGVNARKQIKGKVKQDRFLTEKTDNECRSEDASPVSVLDFDPFNTDRDPSKSEKSSVTNEPHPRRDLSIDLELHSSSFAHEDVDPVEEDDHPSRNGDRFHQDYTELCSEICRMSEEDIIASKWTLGDLFRGQEGKEIGREVESHLFFQLLEEEICAF